MKILIPDWKSFGRGDIREALVNLGNEVIFYQKEPRNYRQDPRFRSELRNYIKEEHIDLIFSSNYYPLLSNVWIFLLRETLIPEMWKPVFRNTETVLIGLMDIYRVQLICQAQSRFAVRSRLYNWVETDKLVLLQSHIFLGFLMPDSRDMGAGIFIDCSYHQCVQVWFVVWWPDWSLLSNLLYLLIDKG